MFRRSLIALGLLVSLGSAGCALARNVGWGEARDWLNEKWGPSELELSGGWEAGASLGGLGSGIFIQEKGVIRGTLGDYRVTGVVRGAELFLVLTASGEVWYTAQLSMQPDGTLLGLAAEDALYSPEEKKQFRSHPILLQRAVRVLVQKDRLSP